MADLTDSFAKVKIYGMKKGAAAPIKSLRLEFCIVMIPIFNCIFGVYC